MERLLALGQVNREVITLPYSDFEHVGGLLDEAPDVAMPILTRF